MLRRVAFREIANRRWRDSRVLPVLTRQTSQRSMIAALLRVAAHENQRFGTTITAYSLWLQ